jgi:hypothetical protein
MYWSTDVGGCRVCPECRGALEQESHAYVLAVREHAEITPFVIGNDGGHFCGKCPVVVLDHAEFTEFARLGMPQATDAKFVVLGLVDFDSIPKEKRNRPIGEDDNPIPLVKFTNLDGATSRRATTPGRRVSRNDYCPCGSGLKFKKCCMQKENQSANQAPEDTARKLADPQR